MSMMGSIFLIPVFAQTFLGYGATESGYLFMPMAFMMVLASIIGGKLAGKVEASKVIGWSTIGAAAGLFLFSYLDPRSSAWAIIIPLSVMAFSMGFGMAQRTNSIAAAVEPHEIGVASSILALARNIAGAFGIAVFGTLLAGITERNILDISSSSSLHSLSVLDHARFISLITLKAQISAYDTIFVISAIVALIGGIMAFRIRIKEDVTPKEMIMVE
jgi:MFS family permease